MSKLRVAMIAPPWLPVPPDGYGGIENVLDALIPELIKLGVEVELFTTGNSTIKASKKHWIYKFGQYEHIHKPQYEALPISIAHLQFAINYIEEDGNFDIIHDHNGFIGPLLFYNASEKLPPVVHTLHGPPFSMLGRSELGVPDNSLMWRQFKQPRNLYMVPISKALGKSSPPNLKHRMLPAIHNALAVQQFPFQTRKDNYFVTLARFHPEKGQHIAVKACLELGQKLKMVGGVNDITNPRALILELANPLSKYRSDVCFRYFSDSIFPYLKVGQIEHMGELKGIRKLNLIKKSKGLLFPIQWDEPFGMAAIEALACGTPVIAMAHGALPEIIEHGVNGFLATNEKEFKHYMTKIDEIDPAACRTSVEQKFSADTMATRYLESYKSILHTDFS